MREYRCTTTIQVEVVLEAADRSDALKKVDSIEFFLDLEYPKTLKLSERWTTLDDSYPDWEATLED